MTLKPPTRTFPKLVMKEWPRVCLCGFVDDGDIERQVIHQEYHSPQGRALSDFTRVVEETGILKKP